MEDTATADWVTEIWATEAWATVDWDTEVWVTADWVMEVWDYIALTTDLPRAIPFLINNTV